MDFAHVLCQFDKFGASTLPPEMALFAVGVGGAGLGEVGHPYVGGQLLGVMCDAGMNFKAHSLAPFCDDHSCRPSYQLQMPIFCW